MRCMSITRTDRNHGKLYLLRGRPSGWSRRGAADRTPFRNTGILLLKEDGTEAKDGEYGEICVKGTCLALGYYHNPEKTKESFVNNPLNTIYAEPIYKTGDLGSMNADGLLEFHGRKDFKSNTWATVLNWEK